MGKAKFIVAGAILALLTAVGLQVAVAEFANYELQDEMHDVAALGGVRIGLTPPKSDDDLRQIVINKARSHDIALDPNQITVERGGTPEYPHAYLAARYQSRIFIPGCNLVLHFHATSGSRP